MPSRRLLKRLSGRYGELSKAKKLIIPFYVSHRGCPERCVFCDQKRISGSGGALPERDDIKKTIIEYLASWKGEGAREVAFYGGSFTALARETQVNLLEPVSPFIEKGDIHAVRVSTRPDCIDEETVLLLKKHHVSIVELGVQSMDDTVLRLSGRGHSANDTISAARLLKDSGISLGCQLMPGLPGDSREKSLESARIIAGIMPDSVRIYPTVVIKGTELEKSYLRGEFMPLGLDEAVALSSDMVELFRAKDIHVIRVGLQAESSLEESCIAGPYHPAFGEMVESAIFKKKAKKFLSQLTGTKNTVSFRIFPGDESAFRGQKNMNIKGLRDEFPHINFDIRKDGHLEKGSLYMN